MRLNTITKFVVLCALFFLCLSKYFGCMQTKQGDSSRNKIKHTQQIEGYLVAFLDALQAEDIPMAARYASDNALESAMSIPVDHIYKYEILDIEHDQYTAQARTEINGEVQTEIYLLHQNDEWLINSTISLKAL